MSRLTDLSSNPEIMAYAQGTARQNISSIAEFLAPTVEVTASTGHFKKYDDKHRFRVPDSRRAIGGEATMLQWNVSDALYNCAPNALDAPVDKLESVEQEYAMDAIKEAADDVAEVAGLCHEQTVINKALAAAGAGTDANFTADTVDPIALIDNAILGVSKAAKHSNLLEIGVLFGPTAFLRFKGNKNVKAVKTGGGKATNIVLDDVSGLLIGTPEVALSTMMFDNNAEGLAQDIRFLLDTAILIFVRKKNPTRRDPSFMKTFRLRNAFLKPRIYTRPDGRVDVAAFDWSEDVQVTNTLAIARINANNS